MFSIRRATADDAGDIHAMIVGIAGHLGATDKVSSTVGDIARHGFGARPSFDALIAVDDHGSAVGLSLFFPSYSTWRGAAGAYIQDFFVDPVARGTGLAGRLLRATAAHVATTGGSYLRLSVDASNLLAQAFYGRIGLTERTDERIFAVDGEAFRELATATSG